MITFEKKGELGLVLDAPNILALKYGNYAQSLRIYGSSSAYGTLAHNGTTLTITGGTNLTLTATTLTLPSASIADAALSSNVPLLNANNIFTVNQKINKATPCVFEIDVTASGGDDIAEVLFSVGGTGKLDLFYRESDDTLVMKDYGVADRFEFNMTTGVMDTGIIPAAIVKGTTTNDNSTALYIGEYVESTSNTSTNFGATSVYKDIASLSLTAGDWEVAAFCYINVNGASVTQYVFFLGGTVAGDNATGSLPGQNTDYWVGSANGNGTQTSLRIPHYRISLASTTTVYLKLLGVFTVATPQYRYRFSARRVR